MTTIPVKVTVSGSFRRHLAPIAAAVETFVSLGCRVLSPEDPRVVDSSGEFLFVASDRFRTIRTVQNRHLAAIRASDLLWLVDPDGYVGQSASLELGYAIAVGTAVLSEHPPSDLTLRQYVTVVPDEAAALAAVRSRVSSGLCEGTVLLDPRGARDPLHQRVDELVGELLDPENPASDRRLVAISRDIQAAVEVGREVARRQ
jgi:hypothetical protein